MILFPTRIDDLPFPAFSDMNLFQKTIKAASYVCIPLLSILSLLACIVWFMRKQWSFLLWMCLPFGLIFMHSAIGFVEQRYLASSYPFLLMGVGGFLAQLAASVKQRKESIAKPLA
jgi:predicted RND superfamily exporter protein